MDRPIISNHKLELAANFLNNTGKNLFLTGKAGTGKTTFLRNLRQTTHKRMVVVAPTGVAAINAGGVTIHSFFQLPFGPLIPSHYIEGTPVQSDAMFRFNREKLNIIRSLDLLVIDEISMVRSDLLDAIDGVLRRFKSKSQPFGGVQVLMIGDLQQLAPVVKEADWNILKDYYSGPFFFQSKVMEHYPVDTIELTHIYRQSDDKFISILNQIRENRISIQTIETLNSRYIPNFKQTEGYITLCSHNRQADYINEQKLLGIPLSPVIFKAQVEGEFPEMSYPNDAELLLKPGAQVMFVKNDNSRDKLYYNGKIGRIERISDGVVYVMCQGEEKAIAVVQAEWQNYKYSLNPSTNEIEESIVGKFMQIPLKTAWAITIHKSQGLTFEKAIIDAGAAFAHGQVYVALSRCKTLEGMVLSSPIDTNSVITNHAVDNFISQSVNNQPTTDRLYRYRIEYEWELVSDLFGFVPLWKRLLYLDRELRENSSVVFGSMPSILNDIIGKYREVILDIASKFDIQLKQLFAHNKSVADNPLLHERIVKASRYFHDKLQSLVTPLFENAQVDTDNKLLQKTINEQILRIENEYTIRINCLASCFESFTISSYLNARSVSNIEKAKTNKKQVNQSEVNISKHPALYRILRDWRNSIARENLQPAYVVMQTKTITDIADTLPHSIKELAKIKGLGARRVDMYGKELLMIVRDYCLDNGIAIAELDLKAVEPKEKKPVENAMMLTTGLFKMGFSPEEIAIKTGKSLSTVQEHIVKAVEKGEIEAEKVVSSGKINDVKLWFSRNDTSLLKPAKEALGDEYSYFEIKVALAAMKHEQ
jgi:hypothetical protein